MLSLLAIIEDGFFLQSGSSRWSYGIHQRGKRILLYPNLFPEGPKILFSVKIKVLDRMGGSKKRVFPGKNARK